MLVKKQFAKILTAVLLLMTFATGQLIVISHTHTKADYTNNHQTKKDNTDDKCRICDHNSHVQLFLQQHRTLFTVALTRENSYREYTYACHSVQINHSCNRGPPAI
ncbi:hypothetical protein [Mucilaginibacter ginkgonis]|uniref:Uncharacterized protein n=1 Tax=Mucilaginibacter ginkgonis TaxID=2682091 RepID=A0A6I4I2S3_9SPHI|nr:hypothetical protein [Mucilaginibacter ginkgonis]QQL49205.1 hypothetical protein GO620_013610 [Mucilaginibacter ginkgonis]